MNDFLLMKDSSEGDKGKEAMLDFVLSWTLRVASDAYPDKEVKQYRLARQCDIEN